MNYSPELHDTSQACILFDQWIILMQVYVLELPHERHGPLANQVVLIFLKIGLVEHLLVSYLELEKRWYEQTLEVRCFT